MCKVSIVIVTDNRSEKLNRLLEALIGAERFQEIEVLVLLNGENRKAEEFLMRCQLEYSNIRCIRSAKLSKGEARNMLVTSAKSDVLYFLDDDVIVSSDTINALFTCLGEYTSVDIFGGPNLTPPRSSPFQVAQGFVLGCAFGTFWVSKRYRKQGKAMPADERMLILCNLAIRRKVFDETGILFHRILVSGEENLLLQRLVFLGYKAMYIPELTVYHDRRKSYFQFCKQIFTYARGRCQVIKHLSSITNIWYLVPAAFIFYIVSLCFYNPLAYRLPLLSYISVCVYNAANIAVRERSIRQFFLVCVLFPTLHIIYGAGLIYEFFMRRRAQRIKTSPAVFSSHERNVSAIP